MTKAEIVAAGQLAQRPEKNPRTCRVSRRLATRWARRCSPADPGKRTHLNMIYPTLPTHTSLLWHDSPHRRRRDHAGGAHLGYGGAHSRRAQTCSFKEQASKTKLCTRVVSREADLPSSGPKERRVRNRMPHRALRNPTSRPCQREGGGEFFGQVLRCVRTLPSEQSTTGVAAGGSVSSGSAINFRFTNDKRSRRQGQRASYGRHPPARKEVIRRIQVCKMRIDLTERSNTVGGLLLLCKVPTGGVTLPLD